MWYDPQEQEQHGRMRERRTCCNVTMLGQMLPKTLCNNPVSESGSVVTTFSMFRSDVGLTLDQPHPFGADHCVLQAEDCVFVRRYISSYGCSGFCA